MGILIDAMDTGNYPAMHTRRARARGVAARPGIWLLYRIYRDAPTVAFT
jgi:hypothetical protein